MLTATALDMYEIAERTGFPNPAYFSRESDEKDAYAVSSRITGHTQPEFDPGNMRWLLAGKTITKTPIGLEVRTAAPGRISALFDIAHSWRAC